MKTITSLLACGVLALALVAGPGVAQASAAGTAAKATQAAKAKRAKLVKRLKLTAFVVRQAAKTLDMKPRDLRTELKGHSLAEVAVAHSTTAADLQAAIVAAFKAKADARVAAEKTTPEKAAKAVARFEQRLAKLMNHVFKGANAGKAKVAKLVKRLKLTAFVVRQAAKTLDIKPRDLRTELKGHSLAEVAVAHGTTAADLQAAIVAAFKAKADARVAAEKTTPEKAAKAVARFEQRLAKLMNHVFNAKPATPATAARKGLLGVAAEYLGLTKAELKEQLPGNSLGQLADATPGKSAEGLQDALVAAVDAKLDALVAKGMKQERADKIMARFQDRVDDLVAKVFPEKA